MDQIDIGGIEDEDTIAVEDGGVSADTADYVRRNRAEHTYNPQANFDQPVIVRGTNKIFRQSRALSVVAEPSIEALDRMIEVTRGIDRDLRIARVVDVSKVKIQAVNPQMIVFTIEDVDGTFVMDTPLVTDMPLAFKRLGSLLGVPYSYSKKTPSFLNKANFDYWLRMSKHTTDKAPMLDFVFEDSINEIRYLPVNDDGSEIEGAESVVVEAHRVVNVLKVVGARGRGQRAKITEESPEVAARLPMLGDIVAGVKDLVWEIDPEIEVQLQAYALGYAGNKGRHFVRVIFDSEDARFNIFDDQFNFALNIEADFSGESPEFGDVFFGFSFFRQICSNGMVATWSDADRAELREQFVSEALREEGLTLADADPEGGNAEAIEKRKQAETKFHLVFSEEGLVFPVQQANAGLDMTVFRLAFKTFIKSRDVLTDRMSALGREFGEVDPEEFVETIHGLQKAMKLPSPELIKFFVIEYIAGDMTGKQTFTTPYQVLNYLTLMARSYETNIMAEIERKAMGFALELWARLNAAKVEAQKVSLVQQYTSLVRRDLLGS